jgi:hypothetical protein
MGSMRCNHSVEPKQGEDSGGDNISGAEQSDSEKMFSLSGYPPTIFSGSERAFTIEWVMTHFSNRWNCMQQFNPTSYGYYIFVKRLLSTCPSIPAMDSISFLESDCIEPATPRDRPQS